MSTENWQKSSYSGDSSHCVEVATGGERIKIRESDEPETILSTTSENFRAFVRGVKAGEFDHFVE